MKILIYTCMWKRYSVSRLFAMGITRFIKDAPAWADVKVLATVSDDISEMLCDEFGFHSVMCENNPLGRKWNTGLEAALKQLDFDYLMIMGDDDLIASEAWKYYEEALGIGGFSSVIDQLSSLKLNERLDYFGFHEIYFLNAEKKTGSHFTYTGKGASNKLIGAGRMISKKAIAMSGWQAEVTMNENIGSGLVTKTPRQLLPAYQVEYFVGMKKAKRDGSDKFQLWDDQQDRGLDNTSEIRLLTNGFPPVVLKTDRPVITDVKTETNLWTYDKYGSLGAATSCADCTWFMTEEEKDFLHKTFGPPRPIPQRVLP